MRIGALNDKGMTLFANFIANTREKEHLERQMLPLPTELLTNEEFQSRVDLDVDIDPKRKFPSRFEFSGYLTAQFQAPISKEIFNNYGIWAWLAAVYFEQLRNKKFAKRHGVVVATQRDDTFVPAEWQKRMGVSFGTNYRHAVRTPVMLYQELGSRSRFFTQRNGMHVMGDAIEQILSDPKIMASEKLLDLVLEHYSDNKGLPKRGTFNYPPKASKARYSRKGYGQLRRLTDAFLPRIKLTHDVDIMSNSEILSVCGTEFSE